MFTLSYQRHICNKCRYRYIYIFISSDLEINLFLLKPQRNGGKKTKAGSASVLVSLCWGMGIELSH